MSKDDAEVVFQVYKKPRRPYVKILKNGTTRLVIPVTHEEMKEIVVPNVIKAYE